MSGIRRTILASNPGKIADNFAAQVAAGYQVAIVAAGGSISALQIKAVKAFVKTGFKDRWWFTLVDCCLFLGADLTSALVKIVVAPGTGTSYTNNNLVGGDYGETTGISVSGNTTKYIGTGVIPANQGLDINNISLVVGCSSNADGSRLWGCDEPDSAKIAAVFGTPHGGAHGNRAQSTPWARSYAIGFAARPSYTAGACEGMSVMETFSNASTGPYNNELEIFRTTQFGTKYISNTASVGFFSVGEMMTLSQLKSLTVAVRKLNLAARSISAPTRFVFIGDSITFGIGTTGSAKAYSAMVAAARSAEAINIAVTGSEFMNGSPPGRYRSQGIEAFPVDKFFCMMGSNDCDSDDQTTNGDPVKIAAYRAAMVTMINVLVGQGMQVIILSPPYNTLVNQTKILAWVDGAMGAASDAGVIGINTCQPMIDTGNPGQYLADTVHLNDVGNAFVRDLILAVI